MSQMWLDAMAAATSVVERDEILLRSLREIDKYHSERQRERVRDDIEEQLRALADRAFPGPK